MRSSCVAPLPAGIVNPLEDSLLFSAAKQATRIDLRSMSSRELYARKAAPTVKEHAMLRSLLSQGKQGLEACMSDQNKQIALAAPVVVSVVARLLN